MPTAVMEALQRLGIDAMLAGAFVGLALVVAWALLRALDDMKGTLGEVVSPASRK